MKTPKTTYQLNKGKQRGVFANVYPPKDKKPGRDNRQHLALVFKVPAPATRDKSVEVKRNYKLDSNKDSDFMQAARALLGRDMTPEERRIPYMALKAAIGKEVDLDIVTFHDPKYPQPYVTIGGVKPAGTWVNDNKGEFVDDALGI